MAILASIHLGAAVLWWVCDVPRSLAVAGVLAIAASAFHTLSRHGWRGRGAVTAVRVDAEGLSVQLNEPDAAWRAAVVESRFVDPRLVLMRVRIEGERMPRSLAVPADAVDAEGFRRLRVALLAPPSSSAA